MCEGACVGKKCVSTDRKCGVGILNPSSVFQSPCSSPPSCSASETFVCEAYIHSLHLNISSDRHLTHSHVATYSIFSSYIAHFSKTWNDLDMVIN